MTIEMAEARGAVMVRPWRVGLLVDTQSPTEVRETIMNLTRPPTRFGLACMAAAERARLLVFDIYGG